MAFSLSGIDYQNYEENLVKLIDVHGGWKEGFGQVGFRHGIEKNLEWHNNTINGPWWTVAMEKKLYDQTKRKMECRYFSNNSIEGIPPFSEVKRIEPWKFVYNGKEYKGAIISEDEIAENLRGAEREFVYWQNAADIIKTENKRKSLTSPIFVIY